MKKAILFLTAILLLAAAVFWAASSRSLSFTTGYYLAAENGTHLLIDGNTPIQLSDRTKVGKLFDGLASGDRIRVLHDGVAESYPARTGAYGISKLVSGSIEDIPISVLESLMDLGWTFDGIKRAEQPIPVNPFPTAVSWANYGNETLLWSHALNRDKAGISSVQHLPVLRFDSATELDAFKSEVSDEFDTQHDYDEIPSFDAVTSKMNEDFFASNSLLLVYVWSGSCTWRYGVNRVDIEKDYLSVHVQRTDSFEVGDCAMAGWFITLSVPKDTLDGITVFDADLDNFME